MNPDDLQTWLEAAQSRLRAGLEQLRAAPRDRRLLEALSEDFGATLQGLDGALQELSRQFQEMRERQFETERQRYRDLFASAPCGYLRTDPKGIIREANDEAARRLEVRQDFLVGKPLVLYVTREQRRSLYAFLAQVGEAQGNRAVEQELSFQPRRSPPFPAVVTLSTERDGKGNITELRWTVTDISEQMRRQAALEIVRDDLEQRVAQRTVQLTESNAALQAEMAERRRAEEALKESAARLRALAAHLESAREQQCETIAREVHDELGGTLTVLRLSLASFLDKAADAERERIQSMLSLTDQSIQAIKRISSNLRPGMLDNLGLVATIEWHTGEFSKLTGIPCELQLPGYIRLSPERSTAVFRILQEALTNVARHAHARQVRISGWKDDGSVFLEIADDGIGISEEALAKPQSYGILGMRERSEYLGGKLTIQAAPGKGTEVRLMLPMED